MLSNNPLYINYIRDVTLLMKKVNTIKQKLIEFLQESILDP